MIEAQVIFEAVGLTELTFVGTQFRASHCYFVNFLQWISQVPALEA